MAERLDPLQKAFLVRMFREIAIEEANERYKQRNWKQGLKIMAQYPSFFRA
jgi:hypothetical protein